MKLYGISGIGADQRVFRYLTLDCELIPIEWIDPMKSESVEAYAERLSQKIDIGESFGILGVSFGGLVAMEISKKLNPEITVLISSVESSKEIKSIYRILGKSKLLKIIPRRLFKPPQLVANWLFGVKNKKLLKEILNDTDLKFAKWAMNEFACWQNTEQLNNKVLNIGGTNDKLIHPKKGNEVKLIEKGEHFMIVDRADEISQIINEALKDILENEN